MWQTLKNKDGWLIFPFSLESQDSLAHLQNIKHYIGYLNIYTLFTQLGHKQKREIKL